MINYSGDLKFDHSKIGNFWKPKILTASYGMVLAAILNSDVKMFVNSNQLVDIFERDVWCKSKREM